ncbi:MAG: PQQ-dependent sugar dehydrogenase [Burkholderiaceae bacterium]
MTYLRHPVRSAALGAALGAALLLAASCGGGDGSSRGPLFSPGGSVAAVNITVPADLSTGIGANLVIDVSATPAAGASVASVEIQVDGVTVATTASAPYTTTVDSTAYASGQHVVRARALDAGGNASDWAKTTVQFSGTRTQPRGFTRNEAFVTALANATAFAQASDGRLFIAEQGGTLKLAVNGAVQATLLSLTVDAQGERGLLGVALHPGFDSNGYIYLYYTATSPTTHNRVSRFTLSGNTAINETILLELPTLGATNHNGGAIHFGIDGKLYVGVGDNAVGANAQSTTSPLGKVLRLNDDGTVPTDNPFLNRSGLAQLVWADGLRNPFTFAVQPGSGRIHVNDVGEGSWEEIDLLAKGANYGWPDSEGPTTAAGITAPIFAYGHASNPSGPGGFFFGQAITGGTFYPSGGAFGAPWGGGYFFGDLIGRFVGFLDVANGNLAYTFGSVSGQPVDMLAATDGALLVLTRSAVVRFAKP